MFSSAVKKVGCLCLLSAISLSVNANKKIKLDEQRLYDTEKVKKEITVYRSKGLVMTGTNRLLGEPIWDFGGELGRFGFEFIFAHNPDSDQPLPLTVMSPDSTILANGVNLDFMQAFGLPVIVDSGLTNLPLREIPILVSPLNDRARLMPLQDLPLGAIGLAEPNDRITLEQWTAASGSAKFSCASDGSSTVTLQYKNLIPHGLYTLWLALGADTNGNGENDFLNGSPLGGVPNALVADMQGKAKYSRKLNYCLHKHKDALFINTVYHSDGAVTGAAPWSLEFPGGVTTHSAVGFAINAKRAD